MQTLYGIEVDDSITIEENPPRFSGASKSFSAYIDGDHVGTHMTSASAVQAAKRCLQVRQRAVRAEVRAAELEHDNIVLIPYLAGRLGISEGDLEGLINLIIRRSKA